MIGPLLKLLLEPTSVASKQLAASGILVKLVRLFESTTTKTETSDEDETF